MKLKNRKYRQWLLVPVTIITLSLGWKYPWIAFIVPIVMLLGIGSIFLQRGRFFCGNCCPRGAFYDRILYPISQRKKIPSFLRSKIFRWMVLVLLFGVFLFQAALGPFTIEHFGRMFWLMCTVTTGIGVFLGLFFSQRTWCSFCPIGTLGCSFAKDRQALTIKRDICVGCKLCEKKCPMNIKILEASKNGTLVAPDCLKCGECIAVCPKKALSFARN